MISVVLTFFWRVDRDLELIALHGMVCLLNCKEKHYAEQIATSAIEFGVLDKLLQRAGLMRWNSIKFNDW